MKNDMIFIPTFMVAAVSLLLFKDCKKPSQLSPPIPTAISAPSGAPSTTPPERVPAPLPLPTGAALATENAWQQIDDIGSLNGRWIGADQGDALPDGPTGGKIVMGGVRADFLQKKPGSVTPWNLTIFAPDKQHALSENMTLGCGFYEQVHQDTEQWRVAFCKGYGLSKEKSTPRRLMLRTKKNTLEISLGDTFNGIVVRP